MNAGAGKRGELAIVLHSHMPYVEGFGSWPFGEEWLLEAIGACYVPLVGLLERWAERDGAVATVGVTPVLADQLALPRVGENFLRFMHETRADCHRHDIEGLEADGQHGAASALRESSRGYQRAADEFERIDGDLLGALRKLRDRGTVELWTSSATHAVLPLLETEAGVRLQLRTGIDSHRERFGSWGGGFWIPECGYRPGLEALLAAEGVSAFCVDQTRSGSDLDQLEPLHTEDGPVAVPIDWHTIARVWDERGYPSDAVYRDYHAQTINGMRPWANSGQPYLRELGFERAREHARDFVAGVVARLDSYRAVRSRPGLCVCALDTELLGHWWYEGLEWLDAVCQEARAANLPLVTLPEALERHEPQRRLLVESSWGAGKDLSTWDCRAVAGLRWPAARAELALTAALAAGGASHRGGASACRRAARELLALQSSDWAFMEARKLAADYPSARVDGHQRAFERALADMGRGMQDFRDMPGGEQIDQASVDPDLRGLAPELALAALTEPASAWGRA